MDYTALSHDTVDSTTKTAGPQVVSVPGKKETDSILYISK